MPTLDITVIVNTLIGGFVVVMAVLWVCLHLSAVREVRKSSPGRY